MESAPSAERASSPRRGWGRGGGGWGGRGWGGRGSAAPHPMRGRGHRHWPPPYAQNAAEGETGVGLQRPDSFQLTPPVYASDDANPTLPSTARSAFGEQLHSSARPPHSPTASPGRTPSSLVSYLLSHVKLPQCPISAPLYVDRPTLAGALKQHDNIAQSHAAATQPHTSAPAQQPAQEGHAAQGSGTGAQSARPHQSAHPFAQPAARPLHPIPHRGSLPLPLSFQPVASAPLTPHPPSLSGAWQPVSRSIPIHHAAPPSHPVSHAPSPAHLFVPFVSSLSSSPVLSASGLHRSQSDSVKLTHSYSQPPPRTSPLPNPPSPAFPTASTLTPGSTSTSSLLRSQLSVSYDPLQLSPHPSPTGPLARATTDPVVATDKRHEETEHSPAATEAGPTRTPTSHSAAGSARATLTVDDAPLSLLAPAPLTLPSPTAPPSLSPASLSFLDRPLSEWTADEVWLWLHYLHLGQYGLFQLRAIDGDMLLDMTDDDLRSELGVDNKFHRGKILKRIREQEAATATAAAPNGHASAGTATHVGSFADERKDKRERRGGRLQRHRQQRASPHHAEQQAVQHWPTPHIVAQQTQRPVASSPALVHTREHHAIDGASIDRYDYYVMQYEVMAALNDEQTRDSGWEQKTETADETEYAQPNSGRASLRDKSDGVTVDEPAVDEAAATWRTHATAAAAAAAARDDGADSPVSSSGSDDEAEEEEREQMRRERHRRRMHRRVSHDKHQAPSAPHMHAGNFHRSHSAALSTYRPALQSAAAAPLDSRGAGANNEQAQPQHSSTEGAAATMPGTALAPTQPPPLPSVPAALASTTQPLAANMSMVSAAFASLSAVSTKPPHRHSAAAVQPAASSSLYPPNQHSVRPSLSADSLSSTHHATHSQSSHSPLSAHSHHSSHSPPAAHAPALSPLPHSHSSLQHAQYPAGHLAHSHPSTSPPPTAQFHSHQRSVPAHPHPHPSQSVPSATVISAASMPAAAAVPSRIDRLSSVLRSSPTFIDEVTNLTILSSGVAGHAYSGSFHSLPVVVKLPKTLEISGQEWREWQCHMRLPPHPNLVRFVGALVMEENNYLVTELIPQGSLKGVLTAAASTVYSSGYAVLRAALDISRGLAHMHRHRLVHRDISSRNILVDEHGTFVIADLGLCREMSKHDSTLAAGAAAGGPGSEAGDGSEQYDMSRSTAIPVRWTSPEALLTSSYSSKSDVWALGVTLWEMTAGGAVPYSAVDGNRRLIQQVADGTAQLQVDAQWEPTTDIGRRARAILALCLTRAVDDRPNSTQLLDMLEAEMERWQSVAGEEAARHAEEWRLHHEQLQARWAREAAVAQRKEGAKHAQIMEAVAEESGSSASATAAGGGAEARAAAPAATGNAAQRSLVEDDEEQRGLELMQPPQQRAVSQV